MLKCGIDQLLIIINKNQFKLVNQKQLDIDIGLLNSFELKLKSIYPIGMALCIRILSSVSLTKVNHLNNEL